MSQSGKVLHLYVEVRSAPEQDGGTGGFKEEEEGVARGHSVQDGPAELLSQLANQTTCQTVTKASTPHCLAQDCTHSQSPSGHTVSFHLQQVSSSQSPPVPKHQNLPSDAISTVHSPPPPSSGRATAPHTPSNCQRLSEEEVSDGKRSVVTFSYIEKASVKTVDSPRSSVCQRGTREERSTPSHIRKRLSDPVWFGSLDSSCSSSPKLANQSPGSHQQTFSPGLRQPMLDPIGRAATQRAVEEFGSPLLRIKLAHALEHTSASHYNRQPRCQSWAGSPVQRQSPYVLPSDNIPDRGQAICGLPRSPASDQLSSQSRHSSLGTPPYSRPGSYVEPHSPPHWLQKDGAMAGSPATQRRVQRVCNKSTSSQGAIFQLGNNLVEGMNQLSDSKPSSPAHSPEVARRLAEEATKVSSIFTEARRSSLHNALGEPISGSNIGEFRSSTPNAQHFQQQTLKMNIPLNGQHMPATDNTDSHQPENSISQSHSHETNTYTNHDTNQEDNFQNSQHQSSILSETMAPASPALPSRFLRPSHPPTELSSPMRDPRLFRAELRAPDSPTPHRHQPPQYTGDSWSPGLDRKGDLSCFERGDCTELARRLFINQSVEEAPVSWTSRQQWGHQVEEGSPRPSPDPEAGSNSALAPTPQSRRSRGSLSPTAQRKRAEQRRREVLLLGPVVLDSPEEDEGCDDDGEGDEMEGYGPGQQPRLLRIEEPPEVDQNGAMGGSSSRSSSGVTGSLGDRDCVSPESSQSSHQSNETGAATSGIQVSTA